MALVVNDFRLQSGVAIGIRRGQEISWLDISSKLSLYVGVQGAEQDEYTTNKLWVGKESHYCSDGLSVQNHPLRLYFGIFQPSVQQSLHNFPFKWRSRIFLHDFKQVGVQVALALAFERSGRYNVPLQVGVRANLSSGSEDIFERRATYSSLTTVKRWQLE